MKRLWKSTLLLALAIQVSHARPQTAWQVQHSNQVAQPYVVHSEEFNHFPRFPVPVAGGNRRQDNWQPLSRPNSQNLSPVPRPSNWGAPRPGAPVPAVQRVPYTVPHAVQPVHSPPSAPPPVVRVRPGEQVAIVLNENHDQKDVMELDNLLSILKNVPVSAEGAHHLYVAPPHYTAPQGYTRFNATYLDNEDEIHRNPPPVYVAPVHYRAPVGYHRLPLPSRWVQFESQQGPAISQGSVFIATTAAPIPVYPDFEQTIGAPVPQNLDHELEQELKVQEPVTLPTEPSTTSTTTTTTESPSTTARLVLAADRPSFLAGSRRPVQRPLSLSKVTAAPAAWSTTPSTDYSTLIAPKWPQFQPVKRPVGDNRLDVPETPAGPAWIDGTDATVKGDQLAYGQKLTSKDRNQLSGTIPLAFDKQVEAGGKGAVVAFAAEDDEPVLETGEAFQLSESQNSVSRPPKVPNVSLLKPTATEAPKFEKFETSPETTATPSTTTTSSATTTTQATTTEDEEEVTATTFSGGRFTQFAATTPRPQGPARGDQKFQVGDKVTTSTAAPAVNTNPTVRPSLSFTRTGPPTRYSPYEIVRQMQKPEESEVAASTVAPAVTVPKRHLPRPIPSGVQFTESNRFRKPAWGTEEDLGEIHEGFSPLVAEYGTKQGTKPVPLIGTGSGNIRRPTFPKLNQPVRIGSQRPPVFVGQQLEKESDFVPIENFDNEPVEEIEEEPQDYADDIHQNEDEGEEDREDVPYEEETDDSNVEDSDLAASDDDHQNNQETALEDSQEEDVHVQPEQSDETQGNNDQETEEESLPQEEQNEQEITAEAGNLAGEDESEAVQVEETANFSAPPTDATTSAPVPESFVITAPPAASEPERQEVLVRTEETDKKEEKPSGKIKEDKKSADKFRKDKTSGKVLGVSTATEVSLMYEICFKGKCVKVHE